MTPRSFSQTAAVSLAALSLALFAVAAPACSEDPPVAEPSDAGRVPSIVQTTEASAPAAPTADSGSVIDVECPVGTSVEYESNDTPERATPLDGMLSFCGALTPGSDVDYSTFETPAGKKLEFFQAVIDGKVDFDLIVNGKTLRTTDVKQFESGRYVIRAYTKDQMPGKYQYRIQFAP